MNRSLRPCLSLPRHCRVRRIPARRWLVTDANADNYITVLGDKYPKDSKTNITSAIMDKLERKLHLQPSHPIGILRSMIETHYPGFTALSNFSPVVTPAMNFDDLSFPLDHPGRSLTDSYYINSDHMLRTHTSAHEVETFAKGIRQWLLTADVYRRDEIDGSHYPVFHQMEGARIFHDNPNGIKDLEEDNARLSAHLAKSNIVIEDVPHVTSTNPAQVSHNPKHAELVALNLKLSLNSLILDLFGGRAGAGEGEPLRVRWIEAYFPFTSPSYEVEVFFGGKWLEILGCGVVLQSTLDKANVPNSIGWAFGLGLERIAMILYSIPDIRLFWSQDPRFSSQFTPGQINTFKPFSRYPACYKDVSFWLPDKALHENDFCDLVRDAAGDFAEDVKLVDAFTHPKTGRSSQCFRINYRSMDR
ncbi:phenylalanyl-tRNA synthetase [Cristinia sonorae]|uniref:Phenylalanine--tRNA ligase, mitochondrial n=1 Tax=Cristinia sonorae TaxID=1940300 RepID=A0A8K0UXA3_9AGAR|nr:phenylalanyl-tRNA synthetase [Cristinia sonorae]